jgi:hypothetical protein
MNWRAVALAFAAAVALVGCSARHEDAANYELNEPSSPPAGDAAPIITEEMKAAAEAAAEEAARSTPSVPSLFGVPLIEPNSTATIGAEREQPAQDPKRVENVPSAGVPMLAYAYDVSLTLPAREVAPLMARHQAACVAAGPARCQVVGAFTNALGENSVSAQLSIRAEPKWLATFRDGLDADARKADGRVTRRSVSSEDLSRQITDTDAKLRAQKALRTRLEALIASRPGKLAELLEIERELARVQGEIDSAESNLAVMRARVAMSTLDLDYRSQSAAVVQGTFATLNLAIDGFIRTVADGFAAIIMLVAFLLPWLIVLAPLIWFGGRWLRRRREAKAAAKAAPAP